MGRLGLDALDEVIDSDSSAKSESSLKKLQRGIASSFVGTIQRKTEGWRFGVAACAVSTLIVFFFNLTITIWAAVKYGSAGGQQTYFEGDCDYANKLNTALHLVINVFSTILLSSSNYCMQCLTAPTRKEVDNAHANGSWLDIGLLSTRNLWAVSKKRVTLWLLLGASSLPLHLFYNSVVFSSIVSNQIKPFQVSQSFIQDDPHQPFWNSYGHYYNSASPEQNYTWNYLDVEAVRLRELHADGKLERLDNVACMNAYARQYQTRGNVLLVTSRSNVSVIAFHPYAYDSGRWVCGYDYVYNLFSPPCEMTNRFNEVRSNPSSWRPFQGDNIQYCLSETLPETCKVGGSLHLAILVTIMNFGKVVIMLALVFWIKETPLMTIGDAIASFLEKPDPYSENMCLASRAQLLSPKNSWRKEDTIFRRSRRRIFVAASKKRWTLCLILYGTILITVCSLLGVGLKTVLRQWSGNARTLRDLGLGQPSPMTMITLLIPSGGSTALIRNAFVANVAQPILSFTYYLYNGLVTAICGSLEWESYAVVRKGLRVSEKPRGNQRSTYFLELPYRFAVPLVLLSAVLHWLVSQSIFLVDIDVRYYIREKKMWMSGDPSSSSSFSCGYSPLGIIITLSVSIVLSLALGVVAFLHFRTSMPVVANCSIAIAAACHVPADEKRKGTALSKVQWGVTGYDEQGVGHCSFSERAVSEPEDGRIYR